MIRLRTCRNVWRQIDADYWMCFDYDVWRQHGVWYTAFSIGPRFPEDYATAAEAMQACDRYEQETEG